MGWMCDGTLSPALARHTSAPARTDVPRFGTRLNELMPDRICRWVALRHDPKCIAEGEVMGDTSRFRLMADLIAKQLPTSTRIADVASGKGGLQAELYTRGFRSVVSWDKRPKNAGPRRNYRNALFDYRSAPREYDAVIGMHPDGATDHIVSYAIKHRVPFIVCPCCVVPSATKLHAIGYTGWVDHLARLACDAGFDVWTTNLPMRGRNTVIVGRP